ncbi:MAG: TIGR03862 family flavoprotein [Verrucomicrobium sp.]|nr:TIGR03862 family flavoprotein [Verrucomicrobium sp.]
MGKEVAIVGGGPAGLRAAELAAEAGRAVTLFDRKASVGRKFLVAGGGGLNLTHSEPLPAFAARYGDPRWASLLADFPPEALRAWAAGLGVETFVGTSGRVFPVEKKAAPLLRRWVERLRRLGVAFAPHHAWTGWERLPDGRLRLRFQTRTGPAEREVDAAVLALGGASWPETGSEGDWPPLLERAGVPVSPWQAANCGWRVAWPPEVLVRAEGKPLKNVALSAGGRRVEGECVVTRYGLEGGALYPLGPALRAAPELEIDLKPGLSADALVRKAGTPPRAAEGLARLLAEKWRLGPAAAALFERGGPYPDIASAASGVKAVRVRLEGPQPIAEAISSAGGVAWEALDENLMLRAAPGLFAAGEMIDWEAPTGGYLLQGCFATAARAARGLLSYLGPVNESA